MTFQSLLSKSCDIQTYGNTVDIQGARTKQWAVLYTGLPCRIIPLSADATLKFQRDSAHITHRIIIGSPGMALVTPYQNTITHKERVGFPTGAPITSPAAGFRYFLIRAVRNPDELSRWLVLECTETRA